MNYNINFKNIFLENMENIRIIMLNETKVG